MSSSPTDVAGQIQLSKTPTQFAAMPVGGRVGCQWELFSRAGEELLLQSREHQHCNIWVLYLALCPFWGIAYPLVTFSDSIHLWNCVYWDLVLQAGLTVTVEVWYEEWTRPSPLIVLVVVPLELYFRQGSCTPRTPLVEVVIHLKECHFEQVPMGSSGGGVGVQWQGGNRRRGETLHTIGYIGAHVTYQMTKELLLEPSFAGAIQRWQLSMHARWKLL